MIDDILNHPVVQQAAADWNERYTTNGAVVYALAELIRSGPRPHTWTVHSHDIRKWQSITFAGTRHRVVLSFTEPWAGEHFALTLPTHEFVIPGQLVADATAKRDGLKVTVELLLLEE